MANGDLAQAGYGWVPVLSSDDIKQGYDQINKLADVVAGQWTLAPFTMASGFTTLTDPLGNGPATPAAALAGGVRKHGGMLALSFRCTSSAAFTASAGGIPDTTVATLAAGYRPTGTRIFTFSNNAGGLAKLDPSGVLQIITYDSTASWPAGAVLAFDGLVPL